MPIRLVMSPEPGHCGVAHVGDRLTLRLSLHGTGPAGWRAFLRTDIGRAAAQQRALVAELRGERPEPGQVLRDIPMHSEDDGSWSCDLALAETGFFKAKAFAVDPEGVAHWPHGDDTAVTVHPAWTRSGNTIYCAFTRQFGATRFLRREADPLRDDQLAVLDRHGYTVIPPSGTLRDLGAQLDHIFARLGCRILHLLPINPTPTTHARYGRFGSPYAGRDLTAIDPALVVHDRKSTGLEQFRELADGVHARDGRLFLDLAINHTGWLSRLQEEHPEWFLRDPDGTFHSPGAWGVTWEDLVELDPQHLGLQQHLAEVFLTWCRRGVDGFRLDAGYMIPTPVWRRILAAVHREFPDAVFLLEGLGGAWSATEQLLTEGRMQWAYSELFQNFNGAQIAGYLDHVIAADERCGLLVHYSETHDNDRLGARGRSWSLFRNRLCALTSHCGGFGFTNGVEWLADEKLLVHHSRGLNWDSDEHIIEHLRVLTRLLQDHPCFRDGAQRRRISAPEAEVYAMLRRSPDQVHQLLVVANPDVQRERRFTVPTLVAQTLGDQVVDLLAPHAPPPLASRDGALEVVLAPMRCVCLGSLPSTLDRIGDGDDYRHRRACHAAAVQVLADHHGPEWVPTLDWEDLAARFAADPVGFTAAAVTAEREDLRGDPVAALTADPETYAPVAIWSASDASRILPVPAAHPLVIRHPHAFRATCELPDGRTVHSAAIAVDAGFAAVIAAPQLAGDGRIEIRPCDPEHATHHGSLRFLPAAPDPVGAGHDEHLLLLTNARGGMARMRADFGAVGSKYDCVLGANLHPNWPVDRHVFVKRVRAWLRCGHFSFPVDGSCLESCERASTARWRFAVPGGEGRRVPLEIEAWMPIGRNATCLRFRHLTAADGDNGDLPPVHLILRVDIEDRSFHAETIHSPAADEHFTRHCRAEERGFSFEPAPDRRLHVALDNGRFQADAEWCLGIPHPIEGERGQRDHGDAYSPGWFEAPLDAGSAVFLAVDAEPEAGPLPVAAPQPLEPATDWIQQLDRGLDDYLVRRDDGWSVIAGYPWFLDWGRDTLICARGLLAAGRLDIVAGILRVFGRFEESGTLPNCIHGGDATNRETSDAALWFAVVVEEACAAIGDQLLSEPLNDGRDLRAVLRSIAVHHLAGTPTGVVVDPASALVWSPPHFTWMDTNHPAGTPRVGYPIEIQVLWWRLLRLLSALDLPPADGQPDWRELADRVAASIRDRFWLEDAGYWADLLLAPRGEPASEAVVDRALRSNALFVPALGLDVGERSRRCVAAAIRHLIVPGAIRSLAPLPVDPPLVIPGPDGEPLVDPERPYQGRYLGDEDRQRKPAYHNGTAWTWPYPVFCEALARCHPGDERARAAALSYLGAVRDRLAAGCLGQTPEILDGDTPHHARGCDAQAWGMTEAIRVCRALSR